MITRRRLFYASLASSVAFLGTLGVVAFLGTQIEYVTADGMPDNAPIRAVGLLIFMSPFVLLVATLAAFLGAVMLQGSGKLRPRVIAFIVSIASVGIGAVMAFDRPFGWRDAMYYFAGFTFMLFTVLGASALVWWHTATWANNSSKRTREKPRAA